MADDEPQAPETRPRQRPDRPAAAPASSPSRPGGGRPRRRTTRDLTRGSIRRHLWYLGWPQVAEGSLSVVDHFADLIWAGRLGFQAIAGLGVAQTYLMMVFMVRMGLDSAMRSLIARSIGARNTAYANHVLLQAMTLTGGYAGLMVVAGQLLTVPMLRLMGLSDAVVDQAAGYMKIQFMAMGVLGFHRLTAGALQAAGDPMTPLKAASTTRIFHLVLSPFLIFGWLWFPSLGLAGAAVARLSAEWIGLAINLHGLVGGRSRIQFSLRGYHVDLPLMWRLIKLGFPASVTNMQRGASQLAVIAIVVPFGDGALAAFSVTRRAENLVNQSSRGLGRAAGTLAGQNLGAELPERARSAVKWAALYSGSASVVLATLIFMFPELLMKLFSGDAEFVAHAARWVVIMAVGYVSVSLVQVFTQAFNTSGDTFGPMVVTLATVWCVEIPLAFALSQFTPLAEYGVAWAIVIGMTARLALFIWYYRRGRWLRTGMI